MPLTYIGDIFTINFDKTITKNLRLQKLAVPLHCQQKRTAPKRPLMAAIQGALMRYELTILGAVRLRPLSRIINNKIDV